VKPKIVVRTIVDLVSGISAFAAGALVQIWALFKIFYVPGISPAQVVRDPRLASSACATSGNSFIVDSGALLARRNMDTLGFATAAGLD
jgi:hypothetical protein